MENLKMLVYKGDLNPYQRKLAQREFERLIERLEIFEKAVKNCSIPADAGRNEPLVCDVCEAPVKVNKAENWIICSQCGYLKEV